MKHRSGVIRVLCGMSLMLFMLLTVSPVNAESGYSVLVDPAWMRTTDYFVEDFPFLTYYTDDGYQHTWTTNAWDGAALGLDSLSIPDYVAGDYWFYTLDYSDGMRQPDGILKGTYYWFKAEINISDRSLLDGVELFDKYHPGQITVNDGLIVFVNGIPQTNKLLSVSEYTVYEDPLYGEGRIYSPSAYPSVHWAFDAVPIPVENFRNGSNEVAVLFEERYDGGGLGRLMFQVSYTARPVEIDIKPGSSPNSINRGSAGTIPVAILTTQSFDAATVDPASVTLAGAPVKLRGKGVPMAALTDVNGDGFSDLVVHIVTSALQLGDSDTVAVLEGKCFDGQLISGSDSIRIVP